LVETVHEGDDLLDDGSDGGKTEGTMSDFDGEFEDMPFMMLFGPRECHAKLTLAINKGRCTRVCGQRYGSCNHVGHMLMQEEDRGPEGYYQTIKARKLVDGNLDSFQFREDRQAELLKEQELRAHDVATAAVFLKGLGKSPSNSEEAAYQQVKKESLELDFEATADTKPSGMFPIDRKVPPKPIKPVKGVATLGSTIKDDRPGETASAMATMALVGMMKELATMVMGLHKDLKPPPQPDKSPARTRAGPVPQVMPSKHNFGMARDLEENHNEAPAIWFGLVHGKGGVSGVYHDWGEVAPLFLGASGAIPNKHKTHRDAEVMVRRYIVSNKGKDTKWNNKPDWWYGVIDGKRGSLVYTSWEEAGSNYLGVSGAMVKKFRSYEDAETFCAKPKKVPLYTKDDIKEGDYYGMKKEDGGTSKQSNPRPTGGGSNRQQAGFYEVERVSRTHEGELGYRPLCSCRDQIPRSRRTMRCSSLILGLRWIYGKV
jgi:hypothetical protein